MIVRLPVNSVGCGLLWFSVLLWFDRLFLVVGWTWLFVVLFWFWICLSV